MPPAGTRTTNSTLWDSEDGSHFFQIGGTLYFLDARALSRSSIFLKDLFQANRMLPQDKLNRANIKESGLILDEPIRIPTIGEVEFEIFALQAYSVPPELPENNDAALELLRKLLHLGHYFLSSSLLKYTFREVEQRSYRFSPAELISFCDKYSTRRFAAQAFTRLMLEPLSEITLIDAQMMGVDPLLIVAKTKENMHLHHHNVACNPPELTHSMECVDFKACNDDWRTVWWNEMGQSLMDAENPLGWAEAVKRFRKAEFGRMCIECRDDILSEMALGSGFYRGYEIRDDAVKKFLALFKEIDLDID